ncbi:MAG: RNA methyltransferase, partial [Symploca sp. SIO2D2]|nr:RNA methyltransferase [Symploca sp. SIO2D2]
LLTMADWQPTMAFFDPLCGSGTLPLEASLKALNIAPGLFRNHFGFEGWLDFDSKCWEQLLQEAKNSQIAELKVPILGSDRNLDIIKQARINAENCGVAQQVSFTQTELSQVEAPTDSGIILCNPPYGERVGNANQLGDFYKQLGDIFKQRFKGWTAFVLCGNKELAKRIGLKASRRIPVYNGSIPCTLLKYELY